MRIYHPERLSKNRLCLFLLGQRGYWLLCHPYIVSRRVKVAPCDQLSKEHPTLACQKAQYWEVMLKPAKLQLSLSELTTAPQKKKQFAKSEELQMQYTLIKFYDIPTTLMKRDNSIEPWFPDKQCISFMYWFCCLHIPPIAIYIAILCIALL